MDENLIPSISTGEPKAFCFEKKDDYYRFLTECTTGNAKSKTIDVSMVSSEVSQKSYCDEEMSQATEKEDLEADVAKHSSKLETAVARSIVLDGEISALQPQLQCIGSVADDPVVQVVQIPQVHVVEKTVEIPVKTQRQNHMVQTVQTPMETPQLQIVGEIVCDTQTSDSLGTAPVCQGVQALEELVEGSKVQQCSVEQSSETPATSLAEMIVEVPVIQTPERTQQSVNTSVHYIVDTVEVEKPKIIDETVQESAIQDKINQVTKHIKIPQVQFLDKADDMLVDVQTTDTQNPDAGEDYLDV